MKKALVILLLCVCILTGCNANSNAVPTVENTPTGTQMLPTTTENTTTTESSTSPTAESTVPKSTESIVGVGSSQTETGEKGNVVKPTVPPPSVPKETTPPVTTPPTTNPTAPQIPATEPTTTYPPATEPQDTQPPSTELPVTEPVKPSVNSSSIEAAAESYAASLGFVIDNAMEKGNSGYFPPDYRPLATIDEGISAANGLVGATRNQLNSYFSEESSSILVEGAYGIARVNCIVEFSHSDELGDWYYIYILYG